MASRKRKPFRLSEHRELIFDCADNLGAVIKESNPDFDLDRFEDEMRELVRKHAGSMEDGSSEDEVLSSNNMYNRAGDLLSLSFSSYHKGQKATALKLAIAAFEDKSAPDLIDAIKENNGGTLVEEEAAALPVTPNHQAVISKVLASLNAIAEDDDMSATEEYTEDDNEEDENASSEDEALEQDMETMAKLKTPKKLSDKERRVMALANQLSITGSFEARNIAKAELTRGKKPKR